MCGGIVALSFFIPLFSNTVHNVNAIELIIDFNFFLEKWVYACKQKHCPCPSAGLGRPPPPPLGCGEPSGSAEPSGGGGCGHNLEFIYTYLYFLGMREARDGVATRNVCARCAPNKWQLILYIIIITDDRRPFWAE